MPIRQTTKDGKPAYQYGITGKKYTFNPNDEQSRKRAKQKQDFRELLSKLIKTKRINKMQKQTDNEIINCVIDDLHELIIDSYQQKKLSISELKNLMTTATELLNIELSE